MASNNSHLSSSAAIGTRTENIPKRAQILVIGGGPAGSYAASVLAREGLDVVLLEMSKFPRYHIGESLLPSVRHYLRFIDAEDKVASFGFTRKPGSAIKFNQFIREGYTDFVALGSYNNAWNVVRSQFDDLLLQHAEECGARVFTQTKVDAIQFLPDRIDPSPTNDGKIDNAAGAKKPPRTRARSYTMLDMPGPGSSLTDRRTRSRSTTSGRTVELGPVGRPVLAQYTAADEKRGEIAFDYVIDASGRAGVMSTKYFKNRRYNQNLKNVAVWGYWRGTGMYGKGTDRENAPFFEALTDESGWAWFIPLGNGHTSIGIVMDQRQFGARSRSASSASSSMPSPTPSSPSSVPPSPRAPSSSRPRPSPPSDVDCQAHSHTQSTLANRYRTFLHLAPGVQTLMGEDAELIAVHVENESESAETPLVRSASDFSYSAEEYAGKGWRIAGDAGAFIDPFFSSGVHLAMTGGLSAAASIAASIRGDCDEAEAAAWYSGRVAISYTRFLVVVLSAYKQIRAQSSNVLMDVDDESFDKAFAFFRPVIQGGAEMGKRLSEDEVQRALDFCVHLFDPTTPEQHELVRRKLQETFWCSEEVEDMPAGANDGTGVLAEDNEKCCVGEDAGDTRSARSPSTTTIPTSTSAAGRLLDVRAPIVDPQFITHFLKTRLSLSLFRRTASAPNVPTTASLSSSASSGMSSTPPSPVSSTFSSLFSVPPEGGSFADTDTEGGESEKDGEGDVEMRMVLEKVNARRVIHVEHGEGLNSLEEEAVCGFVVRLARGQLGLVCANTGADARKEGCVN